MRMTIEQAITYSIIMLITPFVCSFWLHKDLVLEPFFFQLFGMMLVFVWLVYIFKIDMNRRGFRRANKSHLTENEAINKIEEDDKFIKEASEIMYSQEQLDEESIRKLEILLENRGKK